jgi:eukaryotic-like serine/threonine-protein kinase
MTSAQRRRVRDLFEAALDRDPAAGAASWVALEAADDPVVRDEVLSLVEHHSRAGAFLAEPIVEGAPDLLLDEGPLAPGAGVGEYTIVRELGRGGMGRVYLAADRRLGRTVALKALAPHLTRDPAQRERLRREARAAALLTHPGICTVYALEEIDGDLYIATEFIDGHTLGEEIRAGRQPARDDILRTARDLAAALAVAHTKGIVHRDLKPDNVMRTHDGRLKILDFGLARVDAAGHGDGGGGDAGRRFSGADPAARAAAPAAGSHTRTFATQPGMVVGTPAYMAPEQINGQAVDARADVFAFGVLIYEYACGAHPFAGGSPLATIARVLESDARPLSARSPEVPSRVAEVIARCMRKAPADRFGSAAEILGALESAPATERPAGVHATWWRVHQVVITVLYIVGATLAWYIKDRVETPVTVSLFLAISAVATIGGVLRGHLVFTELMNPPHLEVERRRMGKSLMLLDLVTGALLFADTAIIARVGALWAVFALALGLGIVLASLVLEPATSAAAFGEDP